MAVTRADLLPYAQHPHHYELVQVPVAIMAAGEGELEGWYVEVHWDDGWRIEWVERLPRG